MLDSYPQKRLNLQILYEPLQDPRRHQCVLQYQLVPDDLAYLPQ